MNKNYYNRNPVSNTKSRKKRRKHKNQRRSNKKYFNKIIVDDMEMYNNYDYNYEAETKMNDTINFSAIKPRNDNQKTYLKSLQNNDIDIVLATGPAGTGKTLFACDEGINSLTVGITKKLIIVRPAVSVDENLGYLPGTLEDKMAPWTRPIFDILYKHFTDKEIKLYIRDKIIEICPLAYMRGRTFDNAWIIADEMQNATPDQMKMLLTRIGHHSKLICTGDPNQHDRGFAKNGLSDFINKIDKKPSKHIVHIKFNNKDVERSRIVKEVLSNYYNDDKN